MIVERHLEETGMAQPWKMLGVNDILFLEILDNVVQHFKFITFLVSCLILTNNWRLIIKILKQILVHLFVKWSDFFFLQNEMKRKEKNRFKFNETKTNKYFKEVSKQVSWRGPFRKLTITERSKPHS